VTKEFTPEIAKLLREEAKWSYEKEMEKFYYRLLEITFLKIKTLLNENGLKKVSAIDARREKNENFGVEFSQKTWAALSDIWGESSGQMMGKIGGLYGLGPEDLDMSQLSSPNLEVDEYEDDPKLDFYA